MPCNNSIHVGHSQSSRPSRTLSSTPRTYCFLLSHRSEFIILFKADSRKNQQAVRKRPPMWHFENVCLPHGFQWTLAPMVLYRTRCTQLLNKNLYVCPCAVSIKHFLHIFPLSMCTPKNSQMQQLLAFWSHPYWKTCKIYTCLTEVLLSSPHCCPICSSYMQVSLSRVQNIVVFWVDWGV